MKVFLPNYNKEYDNTNESVIQIIEDINKFMAENNNQILSHLIVDGVELYEDHFNFLSNNFNKVSEIKLIVKSKNDLTKELQESLNEYLVRALPVMDYLSDTFYQGESEDAWNGFAELTEGLQWINSAVMSLSHFTTEGIASFYNSISDQLESILKELFNALEIKDTVAIADIIKYEIVETLSDLNQKVHH